VRRQTGKVLALMTVEEHGELHRPPICRLSWGKLGVFFQGVLQKVKQEFTIFLEDGTPVRATLTCTFKEWRSADEDRRRKNTSSADVAKTYVVRRGDTLSGIAAAQYRDATLWRPIAFANKIVNPRLLAPGTVLTIPALDATAGDGGRRA
jgi:nucleoid-associated protein YgaU